MVHIIGTNIVNGREFYMKAFTLSEVLLTIGVIGIVAAMTLPGVIMAYKKQQTAVSLKKVYSTLLQVVRSSEADNEEMRYWNFKDSDFLFDTYLKPYMNILTDYKENDFPVEYIPFCYKSNSNCSYYGNLNNARKVILTDGTFLAISDYFIGNNLSGVSVFVDINGFKKPNRYGRDIFMLSLQPEFGVLPYGMGYIVAVEEPRNPSREMLLGYSGDRRKCGIDGLFCAAVIYMDNWEIKDDYPW